MRRLGRGPELLGFVGIEGGHDHVLERVAVCTERTEPITCPGADLHRRHVSHTESIPIAQWCAGRRRRARSVPSSAVSSEVQPLSNAEVVTLRPNFAVYVAALRQRARDLGIFVAVALVGQALQAGSIVGAGVRVGGIALIVGAVVAGIVIHIRTARVTLGPGSVDRAGALVHRRRFSADTVRGVLTELHQPLTVPTRMLVLSGPDRRGRQRSMRMTAAVWSDDQLETIARHLGVEPTGGVLKGADVERLLPGSMPFWYRRPWLFSAVVTIVILAVVVGGVVGFWMATDRPPFDDRGPAEESAAAAPAIVEDQAALLALVREELGGGTWDPVEVRYYECENDNVKGWRRYADVSRVGGAVPTPQQLDALEVDLVARGFDDVYFSGPPGASLAASSGEWDVDRRTIDVDVSPDGDVWAEVSSTCLVD